MTTWPVQTNIVYGGMGAAGSAQAAANTFVPKIWADEILITREANLIAANFFRRINFRGKKGDTLEIPFISDLAANSFPSEAGAAVTIQAVAEGKKSLVIDQHYEVSMLFDDVLMTQSRYDLRSEYTKKAAYALAKNLDTAIYTALIAALPAAYKVTGSDGTTAVNTTTSNVASLTDAGLRRAIQTLDDTNVPAEDRVLIIPPSQKNALLGIDKFTLFQNFGNSNSIQKGTFGEIYGIPVKVTSNCYSGTTTDSVAYKVAFLAHKDTLAVATQMDVRVQAQYKQENLATLVTSDMLYGIKALRTDAADTTGSNYRLSHAVAIYVPA